MLTPSLLPIRLARAAPGKLIVLRWRGPLPRETKLNTQDFQKISTATIDLADEGYVDALKRDES